MKKIFCIASVYVYRIQSNKFVIPSRVSSRGYKIGPICVCVCLSVCQRSHGWNVWDTNLKFCMNIVLDNISDEFKGQGQGSQVKVAILKNMIFRLFDGVICIDFTDPFCDDMTSPCDVMTSRDVMAWHLDILWQLLGKNTDKEGTSREDASTLRSFYYLPKQFDLITKRTHGHY